MLSKNYHKLVDIPMNEHDKDLNHVVQELSEVGRYPHEWTW